MPRLKVHEVVQNRKNHAADCSVCSVHDICLPGLLEAEELKDFSVILRRSEILQKGDYLYREGTRFTDLFAVFSGFFKAAHVDRHGNEQITAFYFLGEIMGLHALNAGAYQYDVVALSSSVACRIPYENYQRLAARLPALDEQLHHIFSRELIKARFAAARLTAVQKVATLLIRNGIPVADDER